VGNAYLAVSDPSEERKLPLNGASHWTIGRSADNTFAFNDNMMSKYHAVIQEMQPGNFYFIDLGSLNGSLVKHRRVTTPLRLRNQDVLVCGSTHMTFCDTSVEAEHEALENSFSDPTLVMYSRRLITVLVVDIRDFTILAQKLDEALLARTIGTWSRETDAIVRRHGSSGDKYIGDAVMAVWTHASENVQAAEMQQVLQALSKIQGLTGTLHERFSLPAPIRIGAGINTGISMVSNTGAQENPDFSPLGDSVNVAFRLETATKKSGFDVAVGESAFACLRENPRSERCFEKRKVELKGYEQPTEVWLTTFASLESFLRG
jgi:adenylate cyclase